MFSKETLQERLQSSFPDATITVSNPREDGEHFQVTLQDASFAEMSKVEQHRAVYKALEQEFSEGLHSLSITTKS